MLNNTIDSVNIIGFGQFGQALAQISQVSTVFYYDPGLTSVSELQIKNPHRAKRLIQVHNLQDLQAEHTILATPAQKYISFFAENYHHLSAKAILIASKGIDVSSKRLLSSIVSNYLPQVEISVLGGAAFASELPYHPSMLTLATHDNHWQQLLSAPNIQLEVTADLIGVAVVSALKNPAAIIMGYLSGKRDEYRAGAVDKGLKVAENTRMLYFMRIIADIKRVIEYYGGKVSSLYLDGILGDLLMCAFNNKSRNYQYGYDQASNKDSPGSKTLVEGVFTAQALADLVAFGTLSLDILPMACKLGQLDQLP